MLMDTIMTGKVSHYILYYTSYAITCLLFPNISNSLIRLYLLSQQHHTLILPVQETPKFIVWNVLLLHWHLVASVRKKKKKRICFIKMVWPHNPLSLSFFRCSPMVRACTFRKKEEREKLGGGGRQERFGNRVTFRETKSKKVSKTETVLIFDIPGWFHLGYKYNEKLNYDLGEMQVDMVK